MVVDTGPAGGVGKEGGTTQTEEGSTVRDLPKALVKPQVLTHIIEGYVIQEGKDLSSQYDKEVVRFSRFRKEQTMN